MSDQDIRDLHELQRRHSVQINAIGNALFSGFDILGHVLETRGIVGRAEIGVQLRETIERESAALQKERAERAPFAPGTFDYEAECKTMAHQIMAALADRLIPPEPAPKPKLCAIVGGKEA